MIKYARTIIHFAWISLLKKSFVLMKKLDLASTHFQTPIIARIHLILIIVRHLKKIRNFVEIKEKFHVTSWIFQKIYQYVGKLNQKIVWIYNLLKVIVLTSYRLNVNI
jgi:hypothetical protein